MGAVAVGATIYFGSEQSRRQLVEIAEAFEYCNSIFKRPENKSVFVTHVCVRLSKEEHYMLDYGTIRQELEKYPADCHFGNETTQARQTEIGETGNYITYAQERHNLHQTGKLIISFFEFILEIPKAEWESTGTGVSVSFNIDNDLFGRYS